MTKIDTLAGELTVLADLGSGYMLLAHRNGPAIGNRNCLYALQLASGNRDINGEEMVLGQPEGEDLPHSVRQKAIEEYVALSWTITKDHLRL